MDCTERLEGYLREHGVSFEAREHPRAFTAQQIAASEHVPGRLFAKVVMAQTDGDLVMLVVPASSAVDTAKASRAVGGKPVRMAAEREFAPRFPDCEAGAMPPFGNLYDVPVCGSGTRGERADRLPGGDAHADDERALPGLLAPGAPDRGRPRRHAVASVSPCRLLGTGAAMLEELGLRIDAARAIADLDD